MKKRVVICGFGFMGQTHAANIFKSDSLTLAGVVNCIPKAETKPVAGNLDTAGFDWKLLDDIPFFTTLDEAFKSCEFDAAVIALPTQFHAQAAIDCINNGKHVFLEKPLCSTMVEAKEIASALEGKDLVFHVGHCLRYFPEYSYLKSICADERYGKLKHLKLLRRAGVPSWGAWKDKDTSISSITGPVFDLNIHDVDFALDLLGEPENVAAKKADYADKLFDCSWSASNNVSVEIAGGFASQSAFPFRAGYTAVFENAILEFNTQSATPLMLSTDEKSEPITPAPCDGYQQEMEYFAQSLQGKNTPHCTLQEAARAIECCFSIMALLK